MTIKIYGADLADTGRWVEKYAHAEGYNTYAGGMGAHAEGKNTIANGAYSHAGGDSSSAPGYAAHATGYGAYAGGLTQWAHSSMAQSISTGSRMQFSIFELGANTASTTATTLTSDGSGSPTTSLVGGTVPVLGGYTNMVFQIFVSVRGAGVTNTSQSWMYICAAARDAGVARMLGTPTQLGTWADASTSGTVNIGITSAWLNVSVTPTTPSSRHWFATVLASELGLPG